MISDRSRRRETGFGKEGEVPFFLDPYGVPSLDYFHSIGQNDPVAIRDFTAVQRDLFTMLHDLEQTWTSPQARAALRIASKYVVTNLSNLYYVSELLARTRKAGFSPILTPREEMVERVGPRNLAPTYLHDFLEDRTPFVDYWLRDYYHSRIKSWARRVVTAVTPVRNKAAVYNPSRRAVEHLERTDQRYDRLYDPFFWNSDAHPRRTSGLRIPMLHSGSEDVLVSAALQVIRKHGGESSRAPEHLGVVTRRIFRKSAFDLQSASQRLATRKRLPEAVYTGTCGNYLSRVALEALKARGVTTHSFMHSGSISHVDYDFDPRLYIEYQIPDRFFVFTEKDVERLSRVTAQFDLDVRFETSSNAPLGSSSGASFEQRNTFRNVVLVGMSQSPTIRRFNLPSDLMYLDYERALLDILTRIDGLDVYIKAHPKGSRAARELVSAAYPSVRYVDGISMEDAIREYDAFIINFVDSTAFNEVVAGPKPAIIVDPSGAELTADARRSLEKRASFVDCGFDDRGLAWVDESDLRAAFRRSYTMDHEFTREFHEW